jgi:hypothetical protein
MVSRFTFLANETAFSIPFNVPVRREWVIGNGQPVLSRMFRLENYVTASWPKSYS